MHIRTYRKRIKLNCLFSGYIFKKKAQKYKCRNNVLWPGPKNHNVGHLKTSAYEYEINGKTKIFARRKRKIIVKLI